MAIPRIGALGMLGRRKKHGMTIQFDIQNLLVPKNWCPNLKDIKL